jgi:hypothetical protein
VPAHEDVTQTDETLTFFGLDPVARRARVLEAVVLLQDRIGRTEEV